jgi:hypothetical protein
MRIHRIGSAVVAASLLMLAFAAPVAGQATTETQEEKLDFCVIHEDPGVVLETCTVGHMVIHTTVQPDGDISISGTVRTDFTAYENGVLVLQQSNVDHFHDLTREGFLQESHKRLTMTIVTQQVTQHCFVKFHEANGQVQYGSPTVVCEGDGNGGGEG